MNNKEIFTSVVRVKFDSNNKVVSVKSTEPVELGLFKEFSKVIGRLYVSTPIRVGDIICKNIMNTGVDIVCTKTVEVD